MSWNRFIDGLQAILVLVMTGANRTTIIMTLINLLMSELKLLKVPLLNAPKRKHAYIETLSLEVCDRSSSSGTAPAYVATNEIIAHLLRQGLTFDVTYAQKIVYESRPIIYDKKHPMYTDSIMPSHAKTVSGIRVLHDQEIGNGIWLLRNEGKDLLLGASCKKDVENFSDSVAANHIVLSRGSNMYVWGVNSGGWIRKPINSIYDLSKLIWPKSTMDCIHRLIVQQLAGFPNIRLGIKKQTILLYGPPGTGKTTLAYALARHYELSLYTADLSDKTIQLRYMGGIRAQSIVLLDEIDLYLVPVVAESRYDPIMGDDVTVYKKGDTLVSLLNFLDKPSLNETLTIITTNNPSALNERLMRCKRIDLKMEIGYLCAEQANRILEIYDSELRFESVEPEKPWGITNDPRIEYTIDPSRITASTLIGFIEHNADPQSIIDFMQAHGFRAVA